MFRAGKIGRLFLATVLALLLWEVRPGQAAPPVVGKLILLQGQVVVRRADATQWQTAQLNQEILAGDAVQTGPSSRAAILCVDESQIKLNENTILVLKHVAPSPRLRSWTAPAEAEPTPSSKYEIIRGEIWLRNKNEKFRFELEAPAVSATIRGTEINVRVAPNGSTSVILLEGGVCITNPQGEVCLRPGEEGFALPGQAPGKRTLVTPQDAVQWSLYYPDIFSYRDLPLTPLPEQVRAPAGPPTLAGQVQQAESAYDQGKLGEARQIAEAVLKQAPQNSRALTLLGWLSLQQHAPAEARDYFLKVRQADEMALIGLALARYDLGEVRGAYHLLKDARQKIRPSPVLLTMTGFLAMVAGEVGEAVALLTTASRQAPAYALPRAILAQIYLVQNRKDAARTEAAQALAANPGSPMALLTAGLVKMASFDLPGASRDLQQAITADPRFVDAYVYLAKIQLGSEHLSHAQRTIDAALRLAPRDADVLSLAGFVRLAFRDFNRAKVLWEQAIKANPALGEPHLGLAIYQFKERRFDQGVAEMLTATLLEPRVALYQTELGKALYQVHNFDKALEVYDYAKTLDPKDPTPYFYKGIALTDLNRPGEAIQEINKSIELNDNTAMFRSRSVLDQDLAVRNFNLARSYDKLGLREWAYSKAVTALKNDPLNPSANLFLLQSFQTAGERVIAADQEATIYRVLSRANQNTFRYVLDNDYTSMFEMPYWRGTIQGGIGAWDGGGTIQDHFLALYGGWPGAAGYLRGDYADDRGFRARNGNSRPWDVFGIGKWEPTVKDTLTFFYESLENRQGDTSLLNDFRFRNDPTFREALRSNIYELSYVHRFSPEATLIGFGTYQTPNFHDSVDLAPAVPLTTAADWEFWDFQLMQHLKLGDHTFLGGVDYFSGNLKNRFRIFGAPIPGIPDLRPPSWTYSFYLLDYWRLFPDLILELGVFKDFNKAARRGISEPFYTSLWSPRFGINYRVATHHTLRFALERHLNTHFFWQPLLVPTEVASFPWPIDTPHGSEVREVGAAWEAQWDPKTFSVLRLNAHRIAVPDFAQLSSGAFQSTFGGWKRYLASFTVNRILTPYLGLNLGVVGRRIVPDVNPNLATLSPLNLGQDLSEVFMFAGLNFLHKSGWQGGITAPLVFQHLKSNLHYKSDADNLFGLVDLRLGYEFPHKRGMASLEVNNLFNRHFFQALEPLRDPEIFPVRRIMFRLAFWF